MQKITARISDLRLVRLFNQIANATRDLRKRSNE